MATGKKATAAVKPIPINDRRLTGLCRVCAMSKASGFIPRADCPTCRKRKS